jgi:hypothetical protein
MVSIFVPNRGEGPVGPIGTSDPEDALVTRPALDVCIRRLPPGGAVFLTALADGKSLGDAASAALAEAPDFDLSGNIAGLLSAGAFLSIDGVTP